MKEIVVSSSNKLCGKIDVQGAKNSSLPILAACVLVDGVSVIHNVPVLSDVEAAIEILRHLGCKVEFKEHTVTVDSTRICRYSIPNCLMKEMRSSVVFLGSILSRMKKASISLPGGCEIGLRPIDLHLNSLRTLGAEINEDSGDITCEMKKASGDCVISLSFPSVGATENIILSSVFSGGRTTILNAAREPEIADLAEFLTKCGCKVKADAEGTVVIDSVEKAHGCEHSVIPDRIAALTYMACVASCGGDVVLCSAKPSAFRSVVPIFLQAGCRVKTDNDNVRIVSDGALKSVNDIRTMPYPGFPTDAQAPIMAMLTKAKGTSVIVENIFENRFKHVPELIRMGAKIKIEGRVAIIDYVKKLHGAHVSATDLRGGGALIVAALSAEGRTVIDRVDYIERGYENICGHLKQVGAEIKER